MKFTIKQKKSLTLTITPLLAVATLGSLILGSIFSAKPSEAISGWDAGNIMSDYVMTNKNTMNTSAIQSFLNNKVPHCDTWGEQTSEFGGGTRRQWAEARGYNPPYTCLKDYRQNGKSAAQIIYDTAQEFKINPQVLLVLLQKEQSLVTDTWPLSIQYRSATGYGCPDTAACDSEYYGFTNQVRWASRMFRAIINNSPTWYTPYVLGNNYIRYNPNSSCGGSNVNIQNRATQALYNYTPYQPNQAALNAGWGTVHCGAYGNRNFYLYFTSWFGSTRNVPYVSLDNPRWMQAAHDLRKVSPWTGEEVDSTIPAGTQLRFVDKIYVNGSWYLRTEYDKRHNLHKGIPQDTVGEIPFENLASPVWKTLVKDGNKSVPNSRNYAQSLHRGTSIKFTQKININGAVYYRTEFDAAHGFNKGVISSQLSDFQFIPLDTPTYMYTNSSIDKIDVLTQDTHSTLPANTSLKIEGKTRIDGTWYFQTLFDYSNGNSIAIDSAKLSRNKAVALKKNTTITIPQSMTKHDLNELSNVPNSLSANQKIVVSHAITVNGSLYYITKFDMKYGRPHGIKVADLFTSLETPRTFAATNNTHKLQLSDLGLGTSVAQNEEAFYPTKIAIGNTWCLRSETDTNANNLVCIPFNSLKE